MSDTLVRLSVLFLVSLVLCLLVWYGRHVVKVHAQRVLTATSPEAADNGYAHDRSSVVHILAFTSATCHQCHRLQMPALRRLMEERGTSVSVVEVDAPTSPELSKRYQILTVPTTVVLDATGRAHAVNYGFANTQRLLEQVDAILVKVDIGPRLI